METLRPDSKHRDVRPRAEGKPFPVGYVPITSKTQGQDSPERQDTQWRDQRYEDRTAPGPYDRPSPPLRSLNVPPARSSPVTSSARTP